MRSTDAGEAGADRQRPRVPGPRRRPPAGGARAPAGRRARPRQRVRGADGGGQGRLARADLRARCTRSAASTVATCRTAPHDAARRRRNARTCPAGDGRADRLPRAEHHRAGLRPRARRPARRAHRVLHPSVGDRPHDPEGRRHQGRQARPDPRARADARDRQRRREPPRDADGAGRVRPARRRHPPAGAARQPRALPAARRDLRPRRGGRAAVRRVRARPRRAARATTASGTRTCST